MPNTKSNQKSEIRNQKYLICFDLDGTLMDSMTTVNMLFFDMVDRDLGIPTEKLRKNLRVWAIAVHERFDMFWKKEMKERGIKKGQVKNFLRRFGIEKGKLDMPATLHAKQAVQLISRHFENMASVSGNSNMMLDKYLKKLGVRKCFKKLVGMDGIKHLKPNPEIYRKAIAYFRVPKKNCLAFEDSSVGIESAKGAGMKAIGVATGVESVADLKKTKADIVLKNLSEFKIQMVYDLLGI
jgi:pyrophosphatase PpaX